MPVCQFCLLEKHLVTLKSAGGLTVSACQECLPSKNLDEIWQSQLDARMRQIVKEEGAKLRTQTPPPDKRGEG